MPASIDIVCLSSCCLIGLTFAVCMLLSASHFILLYQHFVVYFQKSSISFSRFRRSGLTRQALYVHVECPGYKCVKMFCDALHYSEARWVFCSGILWWSLKGLCQVRLSMTVLTLLPSLCLSRWARFAAYYTESLTQASSGVTIVQRTKGGLGLLAAKLFLF